MVITNTTNYDEASKHFGFTPEELVENVKERKARLLANSFGNKSCGCVLTQLAVAKNPKLNPDFGRDKNLVQCSAILELSQGQCWAVVHGFDKIHHSDSKDSPYFKYGAEVRRVADDSDILRYMDEL